MTCRTVQLDDQHHAIVCMRNGHQHRIATSCGYCATRATRLCDWKLPSGGTCDQPLCDKHSHAPTLEKDLCRQHAKRWAARPQQIGLL